MVTPAQASRMLAKKGLNALTADRSDLSDEIGPGRTKVNIRNGLEQAWRSDSRVMRKVMDF